ncbi:hypothetical protein [Novosphingobium sp. 9]|uniref:hypothetical protein n=1 Tax=Novosphingobium sp. 9 TaxID=2025349 RepID=UPI0021B58AF0|nr:hypothetical protein [Novosphingobium sp. 9]
MKTDFDLPSLAGVLPDRPIGVRNPGLADRYRMVFIAIIMGIVAIGTAIVVWPGLYRDFQIKLDPVEVTDASLASSECRSKRMTVNCKAGIAYTAPDGTTAIKDVDFSFIYIGGGDYETTVVAQRGHPENMTLSLAIDEFWNRALGSLAIVVLLGVVSVLLIRRHFHMAATYKGIKGAAKLEPVWARVTHRMKKRGKDRITYAPVTGRKTRLSVVSLFRKTETPWMHFVPMYNETFVLAVRHPDAPLPIMLDEAFDRLDLTAEEVQAARAARDAMFPES